MSEKHEGWDYENADVKPGRKNPSAVYSVRFPKSEIAAIRAAAKAAGMTTSEFIREAAREKAEGPVPVTHEPRVETGTPTQRVGSVQISGKSISHAESLPS
ncbi:MAG: DUF6290 family protein [Chloroflexota bacterium]|nr:DUF6290 family protein [Chloroflexota bacterium]